MGMTNSMNLICKNLKSTFFLFTFTKKNPFNISNFAIHSCMLVFLKEKTSLSNSHRRRNLIGYKNFSEGALPFVSCLFTISAVCLLLLLVLAGKFKLLVLVASWFDIDREEFEVVFTLFALLVVLVVDFVVFLLIAGSASTSTTSWLTVVVSLAVLLSFLVLLLFPFPVVVVVSSEVDDDLTGLEADEVAAVAECQLVSSWDTKCRRRSKYWL